MASRKEWSPEGQDVWILLQTGDWGEDVSVYGSKESAIRAARRFIKRKLQTIDNLDLRAEIRNALDVEDFERAFSFFTEEMSQWGYYLEILHQQIRL